MNDFREAKKIVVKVGTSTLTYDTGLIHIRRVELLVKVLSDLKNSGRQVIFVTSGAIGVGAGKLGLRQKPADTRTKQAAAAVGQSELMYLYDDLFAKYNHTAAQVLLTKDVIEESSRCQNAVNTFEKLLELGAVPIVNENDAVSVEEIEFGDNDSLSAIVAQLVHADALVMITDTDGLYDRDPKEPGAQLIPVVERIDDSVRALACGSGSNRGTGGMITKIQAAEIAVNAGVTTAIINGQNPYNLYKLFDGEPIGTRFEVKK